MECLATPLCRVEACVDSCPCRWSLIADFKDVGPAELISLWKSCPTKGMHVPEVSAGQLGEILTSMLAQSSAELVARLPPDI
eukprot:4684175-Alexandrium_andersonii.AAC.1